MTQTISSSELNLQNQHPDSISAVRSDEFHQNLESKEAPHVVQALVQELQIVHATAGRIRIRATDGSSILLDSPSFSSLLNAISQVGVSEATWNEQTQSLIISFDPEVLSVAQMLAILDEFGIKGHSEAGSNPDVFAAWKSAEFWKEQGIDLIPLFTGLAVTSGLGISGLVSIPVYMVTANVTRRAISHLQPLLTQTSSPVIKNNSQVPASTNNNKISDLVKPLLSKLENSSTVERPRLVDTVEKVAYSVVHAIPGRIRFNVPRIGKDGAYAKRLERLINTEPHVTSVRVNSDAASIAIAYQSSELTVAHWVSLIQLADEVVAPSIQSIDTTVQSTPVIPQSNQLKTASPANTIASTPTTTQGNSIIADFKPPFLIALINLAAYYPLERICF